MEQIIVDLTPGGIKSVCHASQYDIGRRIRFGLRNNKQVYTLSGSETVTAKLRKPDGTERTEDLANTSSTYVDLVTSKATCDQSGEYACELKVVDDNTEIGSGNFIMKVEPDAFDGVIEIKTASGAIASFETELPFPLDDCKSYIIAQQESGTPTPSSPLSISGYTGVNLTVCGVNMFDKDTVTNGKLINGAGNEVSYTDWNISDYIPVKEGASLYFYGLATHPNTNQDNFELFDISKTKIGFANVKTNEQPYIVPTGVKYIKCCVNDSDINTAQLSYISNAPYAAYINPTTYPVSWQDEAGTVYGGNIDLTTGILTVTHGFYTFTGSETEYIQQTNRVAVGTNIQAKSSSAVCTHFTGVQTGSTRFVYIPTDMTAENLRTFMANNTVNLVYELASPITYNLTPVQVQALLGVNNVYNDTNGNTEVEYIDLKGAET